MSTAEELTLWSSLARDHGVRRTLVNPESREWQDRAAEVIERLAREGGEFDASHVTQELGPPPSPDATGSAFLKASKAGIIICVGVRRSERVSRHAGLVRVWRGAR